MSVAQTPEKHSAGDVSAREVLRRDAVEGLRRHRKVLPPKHLYDDRGSRLFDDICELEEYYPTRTEVAIMRAHIRDIAALLGSNCLLIEFGSGSSTKTPLLLEHLDDPAAYVPIDIAGEHLERAARRLSALYPRLRIVPICADFTRSVELPLSDFNGARRVVYFPGSTIGNLALPEARDLLRRMANICGPRGALLLGVDLKKDVATLEDAYNDREGVTAEFNLNVLRRLNRELDADFQLDRFDHQAVYNEGEGRIEMHLVSTDSQTVRMAGTVIEFHEGETILTECSYKYSPADFAALARTAGLEVRKLWTDADQLFSVQYLTSPSA
jgi:dimethylhistidine N-methyltransferase